MCVDGEDGQQEEDVVVTVVLAIVFVVAVAAQAAAMLLLLSPWPYQDFCGSNTLLFHPAFFVGRPVAILLLLLLLEFEKSHVNGRLGWILGLG